MSRTSPGNWDCAYIPQYSIAPAASALAIFTALPVALVALAVYGLGTSTGAVTFNSLLQAHAPQHARGRIFASFDVLWQLARLISLLLGGLLAAWLGIQSVYYLGGLLLLLAAGLGWSGLRSASPTSKPA
ncbi:MAG: MFS transporter [Geodermatophilaceae bacterium]